MGDYQIHGISRRVSNKHSKIQSAAFGLNREKINEEREQRGAKTGPKGRLKELMVDKGYPTEEAVKSLKNEFGFGDEDNKMIENWIKDIKAGKVLNNIYMKNKGKESDGR